MMRSVITLLFCGFILSSCTSRTDSYNDSFFEDQMMFCRTVKKLNDVVLENNFPPMVGSRNYAYACIAAYECLVAGDPGYQTLSGQITHMPVMPKPETGKKYDFALATLLSFTKVGNAVTFPEGSMMGHYEMLIRKADSIGMPSDVLQNTIWFSDTVAATIIKWSKGDRYAETRSAERYTVLNDIPGRYIPTPPMYGTPVEPHWREIRPLVMDSASQFKPPPHPEYNVSDKSSPFYKSLMEVYTISQSLTDDQKHMADFWDDNPYKLNVTGHVMFATKRFSPPGHWMNIVGIGAKAAGADFKTTVAAYAETSLAQFDAFISCWDEKYSSNLVRPETEINKFDENWRPYIQTPPFPSYTSGHATTSAASAEIMTKWFGDQLAFTDTSLLEFGIASRQVKSFRYAAEEAAMSRLYGGIHYRFDNEEGTIAGRKLGQYVASRIKLKK